MSANNRNLKRLRSMNSDFRQMFERRAAVGKNWSVRNRLPSDLVLWKSSPTGAREHVTEILANSSISLPAGTFAEGDTLIPYARYDDVLYPFLEPLLLKPWGRDIVIGDTRFSIGEGRGIVRASNWDMRGVWLHNHLSIPLNVHYKGNLVVQLHPYDGLGYMAGGAANVYFNNSGQGLNRGDVLSFTYADGSNKKLYDTVLSNVQANNIHIGLVTSIIREPDPFNGVYNVDIPTHSGISFFHPVTQGVSLVQNPDYYASHRW